MEIILNVAWAVCSLGLIAAWLRTSSAAPGSKSSSRRVQFLALGMVLLLLLPVISLSDDLIAAQGLTETDSCLRRASHVDDGHPSVVPATFALLEEPFSGFPSAGFSQTYLETDGLNAPAQFYSSAMNSRPPPQQA